MVEINFLTRSDRADWEVLARDHHGHFGNDISDDDYEQTWRRLHEDERTHGIAARLDGAMVGIAHYVFHPSVWRPGGRSYLADLFVTPSARRQGIATTMIKWAARDAEDHGFPRLYWNTLEDAPARALYDKVGEFNQGLILYTYRRDGAY
ncbi:GNAT family N-acetyltransferase [Actinokineospora sp. NBRC 105648]|uniref:GNAT family N-acetyltransferase n=1 Tax=Actinokineospora sp. NBRC 105648 TaxID=3032206 RepID=UPI0024A20C8E|nr:GNAT family N-acetyltransferase [Actinokineospora sp. NBRC 105648]GLZ42614.1 N-acetyltransferase [Actinokineospora sp. NBRC 105648]